MESLVSGWLGNSGKKNCISTSLCPPYHSKHPIDCFWGERVRHCLKHDDEKKLQWKQNNSTHVKKFLFQNFSLLIFSIRCPMLIFSSSRYGWASWKWSSSDHALYFYEPGALPVPGRFHSHRHWQIPPPWTNAWGQLSVQDMKLLELISPSFQTVFIFGQCRKLPSLIVRWEMLQTFGIEVQKWWK